MQLIYTIKTGIVDAGKLQTFLDAEGMAHEVAPYIEEVPSRKPPARVTQTLVEDIYYDGLHPDSGTDHEIADRYDVSGSLVGRILTGQHPMVTDEMRRRISPRPVRSLPRAAPAEPSSQGDLPSQEVQPPSWA